MPQRPPDFYTKDGHGGGISGYSISNRKSLNGKSPVISPHVSMYNTCIFLFIIVKDFQISFLAETPASDANGYF